MPLLKGGIHWHKSEGKFAFGNVSTFSFDGTLNRLHVAVSDTLQCKMEKQTKHGQMSQPFPCSHRVGKCMWRTPTIRHGPDSFIPTVRGQTVALFDYGGHFAGFGSICLLGGKCHCKSIQSYSLSPLSNDETMFLLMGVLVSRTTQPMCKVHEEESLNGLTSMKIKNHILWPSQPPDLNPV